MTLILDMELSFTPELELAAEQLDMYRQLQRAERLLDEAELEALTLELFEIETDRELELFLGKLVRKVTKAAKGAAQGVAKAASGAARGVAKAAKGVASGVAQAAKVAAPIVGQVAKMASRLPVGTLVRAGYGALAAVAKGQNPLKGVASALTSDPLLRGAIQIGGAALRGENLVKAAGQALKAGVGDLREAMRFAAMVAPFVPGVGTGVAAALGAANALASGRPITEALVAGARSALPGGAIAQAAFDVATNLVKGKRLDESLLGAARGQLPSGPAQAAFDAGLALAKGKNLQQAMITGAGGLLPPSPYAADALSFARRVASGENLAKAALSTAGNAVLRNVKQQGGDMLATLKSKVPSAPRAELEGELGAAGRRAGTWRRRGRTIVLYA